jgi:hypothetical protein
MLQTMRLDLQLYAHAATLHRLTVASWQALQEAEGSMAVPQGQEPQGWQQLSFSQRGGAHGAAARHSLKRPACLGLRRKLAAPSIKKRIHH